MSEATSNDATPTGARSLGLLLLLAGSALLFWPEATIGVLASLVGLGRWPLASVN